ncbi:MAG: tetratricopeptide repeat protein, partial [Bacteroidota bacterium]
MGKYLKSNSIYIVLATGLLLASCSVEKNTSLSRFYHNLTSNYNIYFNASESFREGMERIKEAYKDDYLTMMPIFEYSDMNAARTATGDMERVINKASKLISLHSISARPEMDNSENLSEKEQAFLDRKEYNEWVDDSYLLMGKAYLMKHDFNNARITFLHNIRETHDEEMAARSTVWLARTYNEMGNYAEANRLLGEMNPGSLDSHTAAEYYLTLADMHSRQNRYERATEALSAAIDKLQSKKEKNRFTYILARLYEETGKPAQAARYYREVLKLNPPYEMEFNARINQAGVFDVETGNIQDIRKELNKLLRDDKNREYRDQIYYAHGNLSMREGNTGEAIDYYRQSAAVSSSNNNQKGRSYLMLAEHYYEEPDLGLSQMYYDSAVTFLDRDYPGYDEYHTRSANLNELMLYIDVIETQDSLQYVASLSPGEIENIINGIIRKIEDEERNAARAGDDRYNMGEFYESQRRFRERVDVSGQWYFYNQSALTFGRTEFRNRWGDRALEDNWRRRNKAATGAFNASAGADTEQPADSLDPENNIKAKEYYLKNLPLNDSLMAESDRMIADALFNAARVYNETFNNREKANEAYRQFMNRFPDHERMPEVLYKLYRINEKSDLQLANAHKQQLIDKYPESAYAKILSDPAYLDSIIKIENRAEEIYNEAFREYKNENTEKVIEICEQAIDEFPDSELIPKFMLLKAYAMGPSAGERKLKDELVKITELYPMSEEAGRASEMIAYLNRKVPDLKIEEDLE